MPKYVVVESEKTGLQAELLLRKHNEQDPDRTHVFEPSKDLAAKLEKAIAKVLDAISEDK